jgi:four helix bundle protein
MITDRLKFKEEFRGRVYRFALDIIRFIEKLAKDQTSRVISDQLLRSATSIGANVVEAQSASSRKDYTNYFTHALKSAN